MDATDELILTVQRTTSKIRALEDEIGRLSAERGAAIIRLRATMSSRALGKRLGISGPRVVQLSNVATVGRRVGKHD
jgi:hypothetical protein